MLTTVSPYPNKTLTIDKSQSIQVTLTDTPPTIFYKVELPPNSRFPATTPYFVDAPIAPEGFLGWKDKGFLDALSLSASAFFSRSEPVDLDSNSSYGVELALKGVISLETEEDQRFALYRMLTEAEFYALHLRSIQGVLVPKHYGLWLCCTGDHGLGAAYEHHILYNPRNDSIRIIDFAEAVVKHE
ncbi:hypothetical protein BT96DRAFT_974938, partial [Gymnopus androsaceus JB14]